MERWSPERGTRGGERSDVGDDSDRRWRRNRDSDRNSRKGRDESVDVDDMGRRKRKGSSQSRSYDRRGRHAPERRDSFGRDRDVDERSRQKFRSRSPIYDRDDRRGRNNNNNAGGRGYDRTDRGGSWQRGDSRERASRGPPRDFPMRDGLPRPMQPPPPSNGPVSFKMFMSNLPEDIDDKTATEQYAQYKVNFLQDQISTFFNAHKNSEWFMDEYLEARVQKYDSERFAVAQERAQILLEKDTPSHTDDLEDTLVKDVLGDLRMTENDSDQMVKLIANLNTEYDIRVSERALETFNAGQKAQAEADQETKEEGRRNEGAGKGNVSDDDTRMSGDDADKDNEDGDGSDAEKNSDFQNDAEADGEAQDEHPTPMKVCPKLFVKNLSIQVSREDLMAACSAAGPVICLSFSSPLSSKRFMRMAWITFAIGADVKKILNALQGKTIKGCKLSFVINNPPNTKIKVAPSLANERSRLLHDLEQTKRLIEVLDQRAGLFHGDLDDDIDEDDHNTRTRVQRLENNPFVDTHTPLSRSTTPVRKTKSTKHSRSNKSRKRRDSMDTGDENDRSSDDKSDKGDSADEEEMADTDDIINEGGFSVREALDRQLLYLRLVHNYCYYSGVLAKDSDALVRSVGHLHVRPTTEEEDSNSRLKRSDRARERRESRSENKGPGQQRRDNLLTRETEEGAEAWAKRVDKRVAAVLKPKLDEDEVKKLIRSERNAKTGNTAAADDDENVDEAEECEKAVERFIDESWTQIETEKFKCVLCSKMFKGREFVVKHLNKKHGDELQGVRNRLLLFKQYVRDADRVTLDSLQVMSNFGSGRFEQRPFMPRGGHPMHDGPRGGMLMRPPFNGHRGPRPPPHMMFRTGPPMGQNGPDFHHGQPQMFHPHGPRPMRPPGPMDPRGGREMRQYTDLDAPVGDRRGPDFRELVNYGDI
ncbi:hypothetical protein SARC_09769 [Sphaeroforma arctica JP610]|uniref:C2H2-type domain-containing protein n=1 Tax=Sphaeroforma arctica JP610 TaxID=667725 RepID=A0A0L0FP76_9EUKA|nr:hypothetical protein SARC_09769 [Sphaeroforma arctica JP610]KNC77783.1 hypothetical protein SARC_09769 [Sphaeroforma arctica JP610]|eukprot:XP_014151685.1 hypothetical protein SARC_09769 [Sphaeroforma arctica JP610]